MAVTLQLSEVTFRNFKSFADYKEFTGEFEPIRTENLNLLQLDIDPFSRVQSKLPRAFWRKVVSVRKMARGFVVLFSLLSVGLFCRSSSEEVTKCIDGPYHKDKPSPEGPDYVECLSWQKKSCCTANFTAELQRNKVEVLYNFSWNHCKNLSQVRFTIRETFWFLTEVLSWRPELT